MKKERIRKLMFVICVGVILVNLFLILPQDEKIQFAVSANTAKPIVVLEKEDVLKKQIQQNSFPLEYYFHINNYQGEQINEVDCEYSIELENAVTNFPVTYCLVDCDTNQEVDMVDGKSKNLPMAKDVKLSKKYKLVFEWQELDTELADEMQIKLKINVVQKML